MIHSLVVVVPSILRIVLCLRDGEEEAERRGDSESVTGVKEMSLASRSSELTAGECTRDPSHGLLAVRHNSLCV